MAVGAATLAAGSELCQGTRWRPDGKQPAGTWEDRGQKYWALREGGPAAHRGRAGPGGLGGLSASDPKEDCADQEAAGLGGC